MIARKLTIFFLAAFLLLLAGCAPSKDRDVDVGIDAKDEIKTELPEKQDGIVSDDMEVVSGRKGKFDFGIEYAPLGLAKAYAESGAHVVKPFPALVMWKNIQKSATSSYDWSSVDAIIKEYHDSGFDKIQLVITAESNWGSRDAAGLKVKDTRPKKEYEKAYVDFVKAAVERYDKDGKDDMPGLKYAINEWSIEREFSGFFPGSGSDYVEVLKLAYPAVKSANKNAKVMLNALLMLNIFDGNANEAKISTSLKKPLLGSKSLNEIYLILDQTNYYDVVDIHLLGDYTEIYGMVNWIKSELKKRNAEKEIYGGDVFPMSPLLAYGIESCKPGLFAATEFYPVTPGTRCEAANMIDAMRKVNSKDHKKAMEWIEKNIAINIPRKYVVAADAGLKGINIGNMNDWFLPIGAGISSNMGLMDTTVFGSMNKAGEKRPGFYALKMSIKYLDGFSSVSRIELGKNIYAYNFIKNNKNIIVAWHDDGKFYGLDKETPSIAVELPWKGSSAKIIEVPMKRGEQEGKQQLVQVSKGKIRFELGYAPVFIE